MTYFNDARFVLNEESGELRLMLDCKQLQKSSITGQTTDFLEVEACDYGSPQKCSTVNVIVNRVSEISNMSICVKHFYQMYFSTYIFLTFAGPQNVTVISSTVAYQIVCWSKPTNFTPEIYFLKAYRSGNSSSTKASLPFYRRDFKSSGAARDCAIIKPQLALSADQTKLSIGDKVTVVVSTNSTEDWTSSETISFLLSESKIFKYFKTYDISKNNVFRSNMRGRLQWSRYSLLYERYSEPWIIRSGIMEWFETL